MASYNLTKQADRDEMKADRQAELAACEDGTWPRDLNDAMRWNPSRSSQDGLTDREYAAKMCRLEIEYIRGLDHRISIKEPGLEGFEGFST